MELDLGKIAEKMIRDLEERITFSDQQLEEHTKKKEQIRNVITGVRLLYAGIEAEIKRGESERQEASRRQEETEHIPL